MNVYRKAKERNACARKVCIVLHEAVRDLSVFQLFIGGSVRPYPPPHSGSRPLLEHLASQSRNNERRQKEYSNERIRNDHA
jgi:hypothetical protein